MPRPNLLLIDFENVQPKNLEALRDTDHLIKIFVGHTQTKFARDFVKLLLPVVPRVELIEVDGQGRNALDFHIAYHIGRLACEAPGASIQIVSKDTGFDPLIRYLRKQAIDCKRVGAVQSIAGKPSTKVSASRDLLTVLSLEAQIEKVKANFAKRPSRPRTMKTFRSTIDSLFQKQLPQVALDQLIATLVSTGFVSDVGGKAVYS